MSEMFLRWSRLDAEDVGDDPWCALTRRVDAVAAHVNGARVAHAFSRGPRAPDRLRP